MDPVVHEVRQTRGKHVNDLLGDGPRYEISIELRLADFVDIQGFLDWGRLVL
jgi:hypothetical protein